MGTLEEIEQKEPTTPSFVAASGLVVALLTAVILGKPPYLAMATGTAIASLCARAKSGTKFRGFREDPVVRSLLRGAARLTPVVILVLLVNAMTAVWFTSGTIQGLIYYGIRIVAPRYVALAGLILSAALSTLMGSSVGTVATVGVAVMGIAGALGTPLPQVAGAIMSGALFGDRVSPLSSLYHLTVNMTGADPKKTTRRILGTGVPALLVSAVICWGMGLTQGALPERAITVSNLSDSLARSANISLLVLAPALLVILLALGRVPVRACLLVSMALSAAIAITYQNAAPGFVLRSAVLGYSETSGHLKSGGMRGTYNMVALLFCAGAYTGVMESSGMMNDVFKGLVSKLGDRQKFLLGSMAISYVSAALASNQAMAVIIPSGAMDRKREELGVSREDFAGALSDSGVAAAGVIPWNVMAAMCGTSLGVGPATYAPFTALFFALPVLGVLYARRTEPRKTPTRVRQRTAAI